MRVQLRDYLVEGITRVVDGTMDSDRANALARLAEVTLADWGLVWEPQAERVPAPPHQVPARLVDVCGFSLDLNLNAGVDSLPVPGRPEMGTPFVFVRTDEVTPDGRVIFREREGPAVAAQPHPTTAAREREEDL